MTTPTSPSKTACQSEPRRWSGWRTLAYGWVLPLRTLRHTEHLPGWRAWLIHAWGLIVAFVAWLTVIVAVEAIPRDSQPGFAGLLETWWERFLDHWEDLGEQVWQGMWIVGAVALVVFVVIEIGMAVAAWLFMAIGVRPGEGIAWAWWRNLRRLWLMTPWFATCSVLLIGAAGALAGIGMRW